MEKSTHDHAETRLYYRSVWLKVGNTEDLSRYSDRERFERPISPGSSTGNDSDNDNDNEKPIKSLLKGKVLLPPVGLARLDS
jgi:hypothetical protein